MFPIPNFNYASQDDLKDTPLDHPDMEVFTNDSSFVQEGKCKAGYAVVTAEQVLETKSLPHRTNAHIEEIVVLTQALELNKGQQINTLILSMLISIYSSCCNMEIKTV